MDNHDTPTEVILEVLAAAGLPAELTYDGAAEACPSCRAHTLPSAA